MTVSNFKKISSKYIKKEEKKKQNLEIYKKIVLMILVLLYIHQMLVEIILFDYLLVIFKED